MTHLPLTAYTSRLRNEIAAGTGPGGFAQALTVTDLLGYQELYFEAQRRHVDGKGMDSAGLAVLDLWPHILHLRAEVGSARAKDVTIVEQQATITDLQTKLRAATDDPAADLPGTVRISPEGDYRATRTGGEVQRNPWWAMKVANGEWWLAQDKSVVGWTYGTPVEGTPAAKAAEQ